MKSEESTTEGKKMSAKTIKFSKIAKYIRKKVTSEPYLCSAKHLSVNTRCVQNKKKKATANFLGYI